MAQAIERHLSTVTWTQVVTAAAAPTAAPTLATQGIALDEDAGGEFTHLAVKKTNTATLEVWGYATNAAEWFRLQSFTMSTSAAEAEPLQVASIYDRLYVRITAIGGGTLDAWIGEGR